MKDNKPISCRELSCSLQRSLQAIRNISSVPGLLLNEQTRQGFIITAAELACFNQFLLAPAGDCRPPADDLLDLHRIATQIAATDPFRLEAARGLIESCRLCVELIESACPSILPASAPETAKISTSTPSAAPNTIHHLNTPKTKEEQEQIFFELVAARLIAGADPAGVSMLQPFLRAFDPAAPEQGRISWLGTPSKAGTRGRPSPTQALDFVALMAGGLQQLCAEFGRDSLPALFPGLVFSQYTISRFKTAWNKGNGSEIHSQLSSIIERKQ